MYSGPMACRLWGRNGTHFPTFPLVWKSVTCPLSHPRRIIDVSLPEKMLLVLERLMHFFFFFFFKSKQGRAEGERKS